MFRFRSPNPAEPPLTSPSTGAQPCVDPSPAAVPAGDGPAIRCEGLSKSIKGRTVLAGIDFALGRGETIAVAGVNGAGKTTLLRCLLDFTAASAGSLSIYGIDNRLPAARARVAFLPERFLPPSWLSGHQTLAWLAGLHGHRWSPQQSERVRERFALPPGAMARPLRQFSKGMVQKLGLAALLDSGCPLIVLDEPMSGLDPIARCAMVELLRAARARGHSLLLTSHAMGDIEQVCDRMLILDAGEQRFLGTPDELQRRHGCSDLDSAFVRCVGEAADPHARAAIGGPT